MSHGPTRNYYAVGRGTHDPLDLAYFQGLGYMPGTCKFNAPAEWPAFDFANLNGGSVTRDKGRLTFASSAAPANFGWDLGAGKSKILFVIGLVYPTTTNDWMFISDAAPAASEIPDSSYCFINEYNSSRWSGGDWNGSGFDTFTVGAGAWTYAGVHSMALYWEDAGNILKGYSREGGVGSWSEVFTETLSSVSSFRYVGIRPEHAGQVPLFGAPVAIYYE